MTPTEYIRNLLQELGFNPESYTITSGGTWVQIAREGGEGLIDEQVALKKGTGMAITWRRFREPVLRITLSQLCVFVLKRMPKSCP